MRALIVARDPGAANALVPVARLSKATVLAYHHSAAYFSRANVEFQPIDDHSVNPDQVLARLQPDVLLTGTSLKVQEDAAWWSAARRRNVPSMALLDHWFHYKERFSRLAPFDSLPERIAVMDNDTAAAFRALGCPAERIVVTGQPAFDALAEGTVEGRFCAREKWGVSDSDRVIVFASEPIAEDERDGARFTETDALRLLLPALQDSKSVLIVKLHPRETGDRLAPLLEGLPFRSQLESKMPPRAAIAGADLVIGMTSIFLLEAALTGLRVVSLQPGITELPWYIRAFPHFFEVARTSNDVLAALSHRRGRLSSRARRSRNIKAGFDGKASSRVWQQMEALAANSGKAALTA